jgi:hypothetical protein
VIIGADPPAQEPQISGMLWLWIVIGICVVVAVLLLARSRHRSKRTRNKNNIDFMGGSVGGSRQGACVNALYEAPTPLATATASGDVRPTEETAEPVHQDENDSAGTGGGVGLENSLYDDSVPSHVSANNYENPPVANGPVSDTVYKFGNAQISVGATVCDSPDTVDAEPAEGPSGAHYDDADDLSASSPYDQPVVFSNAKPADPRHNLMSVYNA